MRFIWELGGGTQKNKSKKVQNDPKTMFSPPRSLASGIRKMHPVWVCPVITGEVFGFLCGYSEGGKDVQVLAGGEKGNRDPQLPWAPYVCVSHSSLFTKSSSCYLPALLFYLLMAKNKDRKGLWMRVMLTRKIAIPTSIFQNYLNFSCLSWIYST